MGGPTLTMRFKASEEGPLVNGHVDIDLLAVLANIRPSLGFFSGTRKEGREFDLGWGDPLKEEVMAAKTCFSMETNSIFFILPIFHATGFQAF